MDPKKTMKGGGAFLNPEQRQDNNNETKKPHGNTENANGAEERVNAEMAKARKAYEQELYRTFKKRQPDTDIFTNPDSIHFEEGADNKNEAGFFEPKQFSDAEIQAAADTSNILGDPTDIHEAPDKTSSDLTQTNPLSEKKPSDTSGGFKATSLHDDW